VIRCLVVLSGSDTEAVVLTMPSMDWINEGYVLKILSQLREEKAFTSLVSITSQT